MTDIENKNIILTKKAYIALNTVVGLKEAISEQPPIRVGEQIAGQVNALLDEVREIFSIDKVFNESIAHIQSLQYKYEPGGVSSGDGAIAMWGESDNGTQIEAVSQYTKKMPLVIKGLNFR
jgi:hypothetical protein